MRTEQAPIMLRSEQMEAMVLPQEGGRIASLRSLRTGLEFLAQSNRQYTQLRPSVSARFQDGPSAGIEECLPSVAPCGPETLGGAVPDHGDFWQLEWTVESLDSRSTALSATGFSRPLHFSKEVLLDGSSLWLRYRAQNTGSEVTSFLYACHPLLAVEAGDRIALPDDVRELELYYSRRQRLGNPGRIAWPVTDNGVHLDTVGGPEAGTAEMFYSSRFSDSHCAILRQATGQQIGITFSLDTLPYLGLWICCGGWPDDSSYPLQYAVAFEPTTSPCNSLREAQESGTAVTLEPGASLRWEICFSIRERPIG